MPLSIPSEQLPLRVDQDGAVRVGKTRVTLETIVAAFRDGATAEQMVQQYPSDALADVYSAIGYYLRNRDQVESYIREREGRADEIRQTIESDPQTQQIRERLRARRSK